MPEETLPATGGSYTRDPDTGALVPTPEPTPAAPAEQEQPQ